MSRLVEAAKSIQVAWKVVKHHHSCPLKELMQTSKLLALCTPAELQGLLVCLPALVLGPAVHRAGCLLYFAAT